MESIWNKTTKLQKRDQLVCDEKTQVAVIGGGLAGILTAYLLQQKGIKVIVLEADMVGMGQTKNTTAKITSQHNLIYKKLIDTVGEEKARQYARANEQAIALYMKIIHEKHIDCDFEECPAYLYSTTQKAKLIEETKAAKKLGINAEFTKNTTLPFPVKGAVKFNGQARFNPLKFLKSISEELIVYENTKVKSVDGHKIVTDSAMVTADCIVFATHYPFINVPGYYFARMYQERSYVLALENAASLDGMYISVDEDGLSFRNQDNLLLLGGGSHRSGENKIGGKYDEIRSKAREFWPESKEIANWSAQDCITLDSIPYIGHFSFATPDWYVATGFGKWGMTTSMVAANILTDLILGTENPNLDVFSPQRFTPSASAKSFLENGLHAVNDLSRQIFTGGRDNIADLPIGHGGIVDFSGEKIGAYKDENGHTYLVKAICPHLGCQLEWNPDEKTWDCPCHGSRFDYKGRLIDNPALNSLDSHILDLK